MAGADFMDMSRHMLFGADNAKLAEARVLWAPGDPVARVGLWVAPPQTWGVESKGWEDADEAWRKQHQAMFDGWCEVALQGFVKQGAVMDLVGVDCAWPAEFAVKEGA